MTKKLLFLKRIVHPKTVPNCVTIFHLWNIEDILKNVLTDFHYRTKITMEVNGNRNYLVTRHSFGSQ